MKSHQHKRYNCASRVGLAAILVLATVVCAVPGTRATAADNPQQAGAMTMPPPIKDPVLMAFEGSWEGPSKMGDQMTYSELAFTPKVNGQWLEGTLRFWTDKSKKTPVAGFVMYLRPGATAGTYKAVSVSSDGSGGTGTATNANGVLSWVWTYDNDTKETATLTHVTPDHFIYAGEVADKTGAKLVDINSDLTRRMPSAAGSATPKKTQK